MVMTKDEWDEVAPRFEERTTWLLVPLRQEAYSALFTGTLGEATVEALKHATYWESGYEILRAPGGRGPGEKTLYAKVTTLPGSPLRLGR
jgi:hypothetical protein